MKTKTFVATDVALKAFHKQITNPKRWNNPKQKQH